MIVRNTLNIFIIMNINFDLHDNISIKTRSNNVNFSFKVRQKDLLSKIINAA